MIPQMDSTVSTPNRPSPTSSPSPTASQASPNAPVGRRRASLLEVASPVKPKLIPYGGSAERLGATVTAEGVNFAVFSETASAVFVSVYDDMDQEIGRFELDGHDDNIHHGAIAGLGAGAKYGIRADGPYDPDQGLHFDPNKLLVDPY